MKFNSRELTQLCDRPCAIEGRLNYKKCYGSGSYRNQSVIKQRWFRLVKNYLFYFKMDELGNFNGRCPAGVFVMENSIIQREHGVDLAFSFSMSFKDDPEKKHIFTTRSQDNVEQWVTKLTECSYEYLTKRLHDLQSKVYSLTGKDPLLLVPRNEGACLWAPSEPFSTTPACTKTGKSFTCHLHTHSDFTLGRSKSDLQAYQTLHQQSKNNIWYHTADDPTNAVQYSTSSSTNINSPLERSRTANFYKELDGNGKVSTPAYTRPAPSAPARKKAAAVPLDSTDVNAVKRFGMISIDVAPVPPRRRISPRITQQDKTDQDTTATVADMGTTDEDLIKL